jgi:hypothetical protein
MGKMITMSSTGCIMENKKEKTEDILSICIISIITLLLFLVTVTGSV